MATVNKNFVVKNGIVVEGTTATVNGDNILRDNNHLESLNYIKDVAGYLIETATLENIIIGYDEVTHTLTITAENGVADSTTADLEEDPLGSGTSGTWYFTDARAVTAVETASTSLNIANKIIIRDANGDFAAGTVSAETQVTTPKVYNAGNLSISSLSGDVAVDGAGTFTYNLDEVVTRTATQTLSGKTISDTLIFNNGGTNQGIYAGGNDLTVSANANLYLNTSNADIVLQPDGYATVYGDRIVTETASQLITNKTVGDNLSFQDGINPASTIGAIGTSLYLTAPTDININTTAGNIILDADQKVYIGSASAANEVATTGYVDTAVAGLDWKESVHLLADSNISLSGNTGTLVIDSHSALTDADNGYRLLLKGQTVDSENGIYVYNDNGTTYTLTRPTDADTFAEIVGAAVFVMEGFNYEATSWVQANHYLSSFAGQTWNQFSGQGTYTAGTGLALIGREFSNTGVLSIEGTENQVLIEAGFGIAETGVLTLSLPQDIATNSDVDFNSVTLTGTINTPSVTFTNSLSGSESGTIGTVVSTVDAFLSTEYSGAKYLVQMKNGSDIHMLEILIAVDGSNNIYITEYAEVISNVSLGTITADYSGGEVRLRATASADGTSIKIHKTLIEA